MTTNQLKYRINAEIKRLEMDELYHVFSAQLGNIYLDGEPLWDDHPIRIDTEHTLEKLRALGTHEITDDESFFAAEDRFRNAVVEG